MGVTGSGPPMDKYMYFFHVFVILFHQKTNSCLAGFIDFTEGWKKLLEFFTDFSSKSGFLFQKDKFNCDIIKRRPDWDAS